ncbi:hypothetical protein CLV24_114165 [Pontibacter ummariensis]|uniref:Uncharacterized protein n=1 Tax=Pontibacter ummariensis TaxID=1610492 RepID=A0A239HX25_9BACT|nr:hypothetical protein CLV24_114165 [Pontibacter ummariensis]SNS84764.1 hypothetical protein SAMN06296052_114165 [Pontibacter ummariensis]
MQLHEKSNSLHIAYSTLMLQEAGCFQHVHNFLVTSLQYALYLCLLHKHLLLFSTINTMTPNVYKASVWRYMYFGLS